MDGWPARRTRQGAHRFAFAHGFLGNFGDHKPAGGHGIQELRINTGPGYRVYYIRHGHVLVILLCGGDKSSQAADIRAAQKLAASL